MSTPMTIDEITARIRRGLDAAQRDVKAVMQQRSMSREEHAHISSVFFALNECLLQLASIDERRARRRRRADDQR